ncbi:ketoacyl-ACP synthase III [Candidatus Liberibacter africanus]|uniref:Beta-ketoacyl-[acyl-carrier-protein] synthase III n=1 Tax=Candidatus Liberibacter africanus PTSAPSY TaxID=1277257 RepID=A0A0G3I7C5_LIBAF|nr:beta-ketoacyl-ACP synthase III [Candidatus Liberibacter africanus]AKK20398.1 3-oxoacyl-(acyl carrier protein) synthase III [Candidatus Liberibacter africanus PTSAPSY]QTP64419.1 ketoacyl-ACP synthase III [Candidatus Liberibacter africanus]
MIRSTVLGIGSSLPKKVLSNSELKGIVDTSDEWIKRRVGISHRHIAGEGETTASLGEAAARDALFHAQMSVDDIDLIIVATSTPDNTFPSTSVNIQNRLGMKHGFAFDIQAVCSGFVYAMTTADSYIRSGMVRRVMIIGADTFSRIVDWSDRSTCVLFGDGAGALILGSVELKESDANDVGVLSTCLCSDGSYIDKLYMDGGPSTSGTVGHLRMEGKTVFKYAVAKAVELIERICDSSKIAIENIDWFIPHQANRRIIDSIAEKMNIPIDKVIITVDVHGNTSAASIPLALDVAVKGGRIKKGDCLLLEAMGGGFTSGAILLRW